MARPIKELINEIEYIDTLPSGPAEPRKKVLEHFPRVSFSRVKILNRDMMVTHILTAGGLPFVFIVATFERPRETLRFLKTNGLRGIAETHLSLQRSLYRQMHSS